MTAQMSLGRWGSWGVSVVGWITGRLGWGDVGPIDQWLYSEGAERIGWQVQIAIPPAGIMCFYGGMVWMSLESPSWLAEEEEEME